MENLSLDGDMGQLIISPVCALCKHYSPVEGNIRKCKAFPNIPLEIWSGEDNHTKPYPGDRGIRFQRRDR